LIELPSCGLQRWPDREPAHQRLRGTCVAPQHLLAAWIHHEQPSPFDAYPPLHARQDRLSAIVVPKLEQAEWSSDQQIQEKQRDHHYHAVWSERKDLTSDAAFNQTIAEIVTGNRSGSGNVDAEFRTVAVSLLPCFDCQPLGWIFDGREVEVRACSGDRNRRVKFVGGSGLGRRWCLVMGLDC
jgi:hypothetical protein